MSELLSKIPAADSGEALETQLLERLRARQAEYERATPGRKGEAKSHYLDALRQFSGFVMCDWP